MKILPGKNQVVKLTVLLAVVSLCMAGRSARGLVSAETAKNDTIFIEKTNVRRTHRINIYPDVHQKVVFFSVRGLEGKVYQLYVFDVDGKLVRQAETRNKQTSVVRGIEKGMYFFEVFSDDTRIGKGRIAVR